MGRLRPNQSLAPFLCADISHSRPPFHACHPYPHVCACVHARVCACACACACVRARVCVRVCACAWQTLGLDREKVDALFAKHFWEPEDLAELDTDAAVDGTADVAGAVGAIDAMDVSDVASHATPAGGAPSPTPPPPEVFRAKGVLCFAGCDQMWTLQAVHSTFELIAAGRWDALGADDAAMAKRTTRLVFIGRHLSRSRLTAALRSCCASTEV